MPASAAMAETAEAAAMAEAAAEAMPEAAVGSETTRPERVLIGIVNYSRTVVELNVAWRLAHGIPHARLSTGLLHRGGLR